MLMLGHPTGNQNVRHAALALAEAQQLAELWTCLAWNPLRPLGILLPARIRREAERRLYPHELAPHLRLRPLRELIRLLLPRLLSTINLRGWADVDAVYRDLDRRLAQRLEHKSGITGVYAYEDGAGICFSTAQRLGLRRIYDLPIGYWRSFRTICNEEEIREPAWAATLVGNRDSDEKLARKDHELALADQIVVASSFTRSTLTAAPLHVAPISVVPYGAPPVFLGERSYSTSGPLKVLFVGGLSQRKGLSYLFRAVDEFAANVSLTVIGRGTESCSALNSELAKHRYLPSLPHGEILTEMRSHDLLLFPSLFEGFGLVITEAMSQGTAVLTTPHTAGPDLITHGVDGFIVPIRSSSAIAECISHLLTDRSRAALMGKAAQMRAAQQTWANYRAALRSALGLQTTRP